MLSWLKYLKFEVSGLVAGASHEWWSLTLLLCWYTFSSRISVTSFYLCRRYWLILLVECLNIVLITYTKTQLLSPVLLDYTSYYSLAFAITVRQIRICSRTQLYHLPFILMLLLPFEHELHSMIPFITVSFYFWIKLINPNYIIINVVNIILYLNTIYF